MEQQLPPYLFQQLVESDLKMERSILKLLKQHQNYLSASLNKRLPVHGPDSKMLFFLSTIGRLHLEKMNIYNSLAKKELHKHVSNRLRTELMDIEVQLRGILEAMLDFSRHHHPYKMTSLRFYMDELMQINSSQKKLLNPIATPLPAKPWISPDVKKTGMFRRLPK